MHIKILPFEIKKYNDYIILINPNSANWVVINNITEKVRYYLLKIKRRKNLDGIDTGDDDVKKIIDIFSKIDLIDSKKGETENNFFNYKEKIINPYYFFIILNDRCNLSCSYCYAFKKNYSNENFENVVQAIQKVINNSGRQIVISFTGGEPLCEINKIIKIYNEFKFFKRNIRFEIQTNGTLLNNEICCFLKTADFKVGVSIDGPKAVHDKYRYYKLGQGSFDDTVRGIDLLHRHGIPFSTISVVHSGNISYISKIVKFLLTINDKDFALNLLYPLGNKFNNYKGLLPSSADVFTAMKKVIQLIIQNNMNKSQKHWVTEVNLGILLTNIMTKERPSMCYRSPCGAGIDCLTITPEGLIYPCPQFYFLRRNSKRFLLGELYNNNINDLLNRKQRNNLSERTVKDIPQCNLCEWKYICCGGCSAVSYELKGDMYHKSIYCRYYKLMIPYLIDKVVTNQYDPYMLLPKFVTRKINE